MRSNIESQLSANAQALEWARIYLQGQELNNFRNRLISNRIRLKRLLYAQTVNPAAAIFGESQVGKSYMVDCLLTSDTDVLNIYDGDGNPTGFIEKINPLGQGKESTGLICRFTTKQVWKSKEFPVKASMLRAIDVIMVLVDTYFNDVINHDLPKKDAIIDEIKRIKTQYKNNSICQDIITEDEIYELRDYINSALVLRGESFRTALIDCNYFEELALVVGNIPVAQWTDVFSFLWNGQKIITNQFSILISTLEKMDFCRSVYIKIDAILRDKGTILHVDRLYELFGLEESVDEKGQALIIQKASEPQMDVLTENDKKITGINKSEFCALAMELAFTIIDTSKDKSSYLNNKPFLEYSDILDFPGARSRDMINAGTISDQDACKMILRGKVAYLFNKYSQQYLITNLLFCHHDEQSNVVTLSSLLKGWVDNTIGDTAEKRSQFLEISEVSPLFVIGTKFNKDLEKTNLEKSSIDEQNNEVNKEYRWTKRFGLLTNLIAPSEDINDWFNHWTPTKPFDNLYLLRSYEYSCHSGIYEGYKSKDDNNVWHLVYNDKGKLQGETNISVEYEKFIPDLKASFMKNQFVRNHFTCPEKSWDEAVNVGKDGSQWIIDNLTRSSKKMSETRDKQFSRIYNNSFDTLVDSLYELYHDDNSDIELDKQVKTAGKITFSLDYLFGKDKYFFTDFISNLVVTEEELHDVIMDIINNTRVVDETDLSALFAIRARAGIDNGLSFEENKNKLLTTYNCSTDEALQEILAEYRVTIEDIINPPKMRNFSKIISDRVEEVWIKNHLGLERYEEFIKRGFDEKNLKVLMSNIETLYCDKLQISDKIAKKIHPFVSAAIAVDDMTDMLADISAEMINKFVNSVGAEYYDDEIWKNIESTIEHNKFDINISTQMRGVMEFDEYAVRESLPSVFDTFDNVDKILNEVPVNKEKLKSFSNYQEYCKWVELMRISFLTTQGIPKYDVNMNNALRTIFIRYIFNQEALSDMVLKNKILQSLESIRMYENN